MCAYVIAVCGAGGKSTYIKRRAEEYAVCKKRVAVTTTTHIFNTEKYSIYDNIEFCARPVPSRDGDGKAEKAEYPGDAEYERLCRISDYVLVEADGSRRMPVKIPAGYEPVIPENADEIVVVMGAHAIGRKLKTVCHRFELLEGNEELCKKLLKAAEEKRPWRNEEKENETEKKSARRQEQKGNVTEENTDKEKEAGESDANIKNAEETLPLIPIGEIIVTEEIIKRLAEEAYIKPLKERYPEKKVVFFLSDMRRDFSERTERYGKRKDCESSVNLVLLCSGFGRRFGSNKLLCDYKGKPLYMNTLANIVSAAAKLKREFGDIEKNEEFTEAEAEKRGKLSDMGLKVSVTVVSRYEEILDKDYAGLFPEAKGISFETAFNPDYKEGIAGSVRAGIRASIARGAGRTAFFVADQPELDGGTIADFLSCCICSGKTLGVMYADGYMRNPAVIGEKYYPEVLSLKGDRGCIGVIKKHKSETFLYQTEPEKLKDIDEVKDLG